MDAATKHVLAICSDYLFLHLLDMEHTTLPAPRHHCAGKRARLGIESVNDKAKAAVVVPSRQIKVQNADLMTEFEKKRRVRGDGTISTLVDACAAMWQGV
jgi:hypothetical protein